MVSTTGEHHAYYELDEALRPMEKELPAVLSESVAEPRLTALLTGAFGLLALLLAAIGVYGLLTPLLR